MSSTWREKGQRMLVKYVPLPLCTVVQWFLLSYKNKDDSWSVGVWWPIYQWQTYFLWRSTVCVRGLLRLWINTLTVPLVANNDVWTTTCLLGMYWSSPPPPHCCCHSGPNNFCCGSDIGKCQGHKCLVRHTIGMITPHHHHSEWTCLHSVGPWFKIFFITLC